MIMCLLSTWLLGICSGTRSSWDSSPPARCKKQSPCHLSSSLFSLSFSFSLSLNVSFPNVFLDALLQSVTRCYRVLQSIAEYCRVLQSARECYRVFQSVTECYWVLQSVTECYKVLQSATECYRVLQSISSASTWTNFWACFLRNWKWYFAKLGRDAAESGLAQISPEEKPSEL